MNKVHKLNTLNNLILECLLPELSKEFDTTQIDSASFKEFHNILNAYLVSLFDLIQQNEVFLIEDDNEYIELKYNLTLLLCEQTANNTLYQTHDIQLLNNLNYLIDKYFETLLNNNKIEVKVQNYYKSKLNKNCWKKNIGAASGFYRYLQIHYLNNNKFIDSEFVTFVLSVGLLFKDFYEPYYKEIGINILIILLNRVNKQTLSSMNISSIVFKETFDEISKLNSNTGIKSIWTCLFDSLILINDNTKHSFSKWSQIDDFINSLINNITFSKNDEIWLILFKFLSKISKFYTIKEIHFKIDDLNYNELRVYCCNLNCLVMLRWAKEILELYVRESNYLMSKAETVILVLKEMHLTYLYCILPIDVDILEPHLIMFLEKFSLILTETIKINYLDVCIKKEVKEFFETIIYHIEKSKSEEILQFNNAFKNLINNEFFYFVKYDK